MLLCFASSTSTSKRKKILSQKKVFFLAERKFVLQRRQIQQVNFTNGKKDKSIFSFCHILSCNFVYLTFAIFRLVSLFNRLTDYDNLSNCRIGSFAIYFNWLLNCQSVFKKFPFNVFLCIVFFW